MALERKEKSLRACLKKSVYVIARRNDEGTYQLVHPEAIRASPAGRSINNGIAALAS